MSAQLPVTPAVAAISGSRLDALLPLFASEIAVVQVTGDGADWQHADAVAFTRATLQHLSMAKEFGFEHGRAYHVYPNLVQPRWMFPAGAAGRRALDEYVPHRLGGKLLKLWTRASMLRNRNMLVIATRQLPLLERELSDRLQQRVQLAFSFGTPGAYNKIAATVLDGEHRAIAFAKIATLPFARAVTLHEEQILRELGSCAALRSQIPEVKASFQLQGAQVLVVSAGPKGHPSPRFEASHAAFLQTLAEHTTRTLRFEDSGMWRNMQAAFACIESRLAPTWRTLLQSVLEFLHRELGGVLLPMRMAHRDFVPWNMRSSSDGSLYVFDWEFAEQEYTPLYDTFHFEFMVRLLLLRRRWTVPGLVKYLRSVRPEQSIRTSVAFLTFLADLTLSYFLALYREGAQRLRPEDIVFTQAESLLNAWEQWL